MELPWWANWRCWFPWVIGGLVLWGLGQALMDARGDLSKLRMDLHQVRPGWIALSAGLYVLAQWPSAQFWRGVLRVLGIPIGRWTAFRAFFLGHLGKYVPSKLLVVVLRANFVSRSQQDLPLTAASVFVETLTTMTVGAALAAVLFLTSIPTDVRLRWLAAGLLVACWCASWPRHLRLLARYALKRKWGIPIDESLKQIRGKLIAAGWGCGAVTWLLMGASLWAVLHALQGSWDAGGPTSEGLPVHWSLLPRMTAAISLAVVAGFVSMIPGGLLVREWVMMEMLQPVVGEALALTIPVLLRVIWLASEITGAAVLACCSPRSWTLEASPSG